MKDTLQEPRVERKDTTHIAAEEKKKKRKRPPHTHTHTHTHILSNAHAQCTLPAQAQRTGPCAANRIEMGMRDCRRKNPHPTPTLIPWVRIADANELGRGV